VSALESKTAYALDRRIIKNFMDIIVLKHLKNNHPVSGYDVIKYFRKKFHMLPSSGTVYSLLYSLERENLIKGSMNQRKRMYKLTDEGEKFLRDVRITSNHIKAVFASIFSEVQS
jgi:DNA-binding PadR family transcriptional regulator